MSLDAMRNRTVAVLLGGQSAEREISLLSGTAIADAIVSLGFEVRKVDPASPGWLQQLRDVGFAFVALHGPGGEDGTVQGALQTMGIPYSGSGVLGSALAMDKLRSKQLWQALTLPTPGYVTLTPDSNWNEIIGRFGKLFVKPAREGSSYGMAIADSAAALSAAFELASKFDGPVLAEQYIDGPEYTVAVLGEAALPAICLETDNSFYDYDAKYLSDKTRYLCPCGLLAEEERAMSELSLAAFRALDCGVWGRVDLMRAASGEFYLLEINTIPGMTSHSLVPMAAAAAGLDMPALIERVIALSLEVER